MLQEFSYLAPKTLKELYKLLDKHAGKARILAGGTDLLVELHNGWAAPEYLIDIKKVPELNGISFDKKKGLSIGATTLCIDLINSKTVQKEYPLLADAAGRIGSPQLRNRATVAGNLCTASPCADLGCSMLALGAKAVLGSSKGERTIPLKDFFTGPKKTQIHNNEVFVKIIVPTEMIGAKFGMEKLKRIKGHDIALASVAVAQKGNVLRIGVGSCGPTPLVLKDFTPKTSIDTMLKEADKTLCPISDVRATKEYRMFMAKNYIEKIVTGLK